MRSHGEPDTDDDATLHSNSRSIDRHFTSRYRRQLDSVKLNYGCLTEHRRVITPSSLSETDQTRLLLLLLLHYLQFTAAHPAHITRSTKLPTHSLTHATRLCVDRWPQSQVVDAKNTENSMHSNGLDLKIIVTIITIIAIIDFKVP